MDLKLYCDIQIYPKLFSLVLIPTVGIMWDGDGWGKKLRIDIMILNFSIRLVYYKPRKK